MADEIKTTEPSVADRVETRLAEIDASFDAKIDAKTEEIRTENAELKTRLEKAEEKIRMIPRGTEADTSGPKPISFRKLFLGMTSGDWTESGYELEVVKAGRALSVGTDTAGGYVVPTEYMASEFIELLRASQVTKMAGARELNGLVGSPVEMGKQGTAGVAYWTAENAAITDSSQAFTEVSLTPHGLKALTKVSNRLLRMSDPSIEAIVREDMAQTIGLALDLAALKGTGASNQPTGITLTTGINTKSMNAVVTLALLEDMVYELEADNALKGRLGWVFHPREWSIVRALLAAQQSNVMDPFGKDGVVGMLWGYPVYTSTQLSITINTDEGEIFFGDWSQLVIGQWGSIEFMASQHADTAFAADQTWIRAVVDVDIAVRQPTAFCYCGDARVS